MELERLMAARLSLREKQKERTREQIIGAAVALLDEGSEEAVTIRAVAARAGVTERTVFRHIGSRGKLLNAAWRAMKQVIEGQSVPKTPDALADRPRVIFPRLDQLRGAVRAYLYSSSRRAARAPASEESRQAMMSCVGQALKGLSEEELRRRAAIAQVIASAYAWDLMQQKWGFSGKEAAEASSEAIDILLYRRLP